MSNQSLISIIVPCFNQAHFLNESLQSVLDQSYTNWECVIVNDGSLDNTEEISLDWCIKDKRFRYVKKENGGLSSARNAGIEISIGEYILPLDSDDIIHPSYLEKINSAFHHDPNLKLVGSRIQFFGTKNTEYVLPDYSFKKQLVRNCFVCCSSFKKVDWERIHGYDEQMKSFEDWEFWIRLLDDKSEVHKIPEMMFFYRKHKQGSLSNSFKTDVDYYYSLYEYVYKKNKLIYDNYFSTPIIAFNENLELAAFSEKVKSSWLFKLYIILKKRL
jgi:glycosyltransferase involved in cell wall biosynthesis